VSHQHERYEARPFLKIRRAYLDILAAGRRRHLIHGLVEVDVTEARRRLHAHSTHTAPRLSITAFLIYCVAQAVEADRMMHAHRHGKRLILFEEVDVNSQIEADLDDQKIIQSLLVRQANGKSVAQISQEIHDAHKHVAAGEAAIGPRWRS
jgi:pyruvate/2-oxoglutarate dehydrogenase complex dihydrolipoamide acyltransferase (E2) component